METKPGYKTTEAWTGTAFGASMIELMREGVFVNEWVQGAAIVSIALVAGWYMKVRTEAKREAQ